MPSRTVPSLAEGPPVYDTLVMRYLHTMVRVSDLEASLEFYCQHLGLVEQRRVDVEAGRFTLVFLGAPGNPEAQVELTHNWDPEPYSKRGALCPLKNLGSPWRTSENGDR
jgi:catechol 2,3-dioxygenase-like lactoylglutathione lyase family enzyme